MTFPYPEKPEEWQKAYTRDMAHGESKRYQNNLTGPILLVILFVVAYGLFCGARLIFFGSVSPLMRMALAGAMVLASLAFLAYMLVKVFRVSASFLPKFYRTPEGLDTRKIITNRLFGVSKLPPPLNLFSQFKYILIKDGEILKKDEWPAWSACNLGGPVMLIVFDGCALYLERGNRFSRVVGPGTSFLEWFETIKYVVDLRPKVKADSFEVWTKDGIKVKFTVQIECRIGDPAKYDPAYNLTYPYEPLAVKKAIERYALRWPNRLDGDPSEFTWIDAVWGQVTGIIPSYVGGRLLDDLFIADRQCGQILSPDATKEIFEKLNNATKGFGVFVTDFQIIKIELPKEVNDRQKHHWKAERQSIATLANGDTKAHNIRVRESVRADAQRNLILTIAKGLDKNKDDQYIEPLLLSLSGLLDESLKDPLSRADLARQKLESLEELQKILSQQALGIDSKGSEENESSSQSVSGYWRTKKPPLAHYLGDSSDGSG